MQTVLDAERAVFLDKARRAIAYIRDAPISDVFIEDQEWRCGVGAGAMRAWRTTRIVLEPVFGKGVGSPIKLGMAVEVYQEDECLQTCIWLIRAKELMTRKYCNEWETHWDVGKALADVEQLLELI